ncbi:MAG: beta-N-acetylhexosaminidase [Thermodesulfobacteriota bacterium]
MPHSPASALFMAGLPGHDLDPGTARLIAEAGVNHFILFRRNVREPEQVWELTAALRRACAAAGLPPPLIAIDQEGGTVARLPPPFHQLAAARALGQAADPEAAVAASAARCAEDLAAVGIPMNLAPVLDVAAAGAGCYMESRSLASEPERVARLGCRMISELDSRGIAACGKHFPGLGAVILDPHQTLPRVALDEADLRQRDLVPFVAAIQAGIPALMTSHTIYTGLDPDRPATLSARINTGLLRDELGYDGVLVTDDLEMGAIRDWGTVPEAALAAVHAGADLVLICHNQDLVRSAIDLVERARDRGTLPAPRLAASRRRLARLQDRFATAAGRLSREALQEVMAGRPLHGKACAGIS